MSKNRVFLCVCVVLSPLAIFAATPDEDFDKLFGKEAKQAAASPNGKDQAAFAAKLLAGAKLVEEQKELQALLYEKAYDFGIKDPDGYPTALDAMNQLSALVPDKAPQCQAKLLNVRQLRFSHTTGDQKKEAGEELVTFLISLAAQSEQASKFDESVTLLRRALETAAFIKSDRKTEISDKLKTILSGQQSKKEFESLKARLAAEPKNAALRKSLVVACLGEFYNPEEAAKLLTDDLDAKFLALARLALEKPDSLTEQQLPELAGWYADLADKATPAAQGILWGHARTCCNRYLELHAAKDSDRLNVSMLLERVDKGLAKVAAQAAKDKVPARPEKTVVQKTEDSKGQKIVDLMKFVDPATDAANGTWTLKDGVLTCARANNNRARLLFRYKPPEEYDFVVEFTRKEGDSNIEMVAIAYDYQLMWMMKTESVFSHKPHCWENNPSLAKFGLKTGQKYVSVLQVRKSGIKAFVDGKLISQVTDKYVTEHGETSKPLRLGVNAHDSMAIFHKAIVIEVTGRGEIIDAPNNKDNVPTTKAK